MYIEVHKICLCNILYYISGIHICVVLPGSCLSEVIYTISVSLSAGNTVVVFVDEKCDYSITIEVRFASFITSPVTRYPYWRGKYIYLLLKIIM